MFPKNRLAGAAALGLALAPLARAQAPDQVAGAHAQGRFFEAYYLEHEEGDLEAALELYRDVADDRGVSQELRSKARQRGDALAEELASSDFARLVPAETIVYLELNRPGEQLARLLGQLGLLQGSEGSGDVAVSPLLVEGLLGVRGAAVALTHVDPGGGPPAGVAILHPGDMEAARGLIETALPAGGQRVDPIGGHDTWSIEGQAIVTLTERLVLASLDRAHIEGVLERLGNGGEDSLAGNPDLEDTLAMRGKDLLFFCVNAEPILPQLQSMLGQMARHEPEMGMMLALLDVESTRALAGRLGVDESGISLDVGLQLAEDHRNVVFNLMRSPHVTKRTLELVPSGSAGFLATAVNRPGDVPPSVTDAEGRPVVTMMDLGREVFSNVVDVALYVMPGTTAIHGERIPDVGLALTVNDPERSRALWNLVLGLAKGSSGGGDMRPEEKRLGDATVERYDIQGVGLYLMTDGNRLVFTPSERTLQAAVDAGRGENVLRDEFYREALESLTDTQTMAMAVSVGRSAEIARAYMGERDLREAEPYLGMLEGTVVSTAVEHSATTLGFSARVDGLPRVGGLVSQLVKSRLHGPSSSAWSPVGVAPPEPPAAREVSRDAGDVRERFEELVERGDHQRARALVEPVVEALDENALELNNLAWYLLTEERYASRYDDLALPIAKKANVLSEFGNWYYLDTLAHALAANGQAAKAAEVQRKAVEIGRAQGDPAVASAEQALARFESRAEVDQL